MARTTQTTTKRRRSYIGPPQRAFAEVQWVWRILSGTEKAAYAALGQRMTGVGADGSAKPMSAYQCYMSLNVTRAAMSLRPLHEPPVVPDLVPYLADVQLAATTANVDHRGVGTLLLTLHAAPFDGPVLVTFAKPSAIYRVPPPPTEYKIGGVLDGIPAEGVDMTALFSKKYHGAGVGYKIAARLIPLSLLGFRGQPVTAMVTVTLGDGPSALDRAPRDAP